MMLKVMRNPWGAFGKVWAVIVLLAGATPLRAYDLPRRGFIGIVLAPVPEALRAKLPAPADQGVLAQGLIADGPAQKGGILSNDVILKVDNTDIYSVPQLLSLLNSSPVGVNLKLELWRERQRLSKTVTVQPRPYETSTEFDIVYRTIVVDDTRRRVIVTKPKSAGPHPALLFVPGVGCFSQDLTPERPIAKILYALTHQGFVTMRVEKSGMGDSEGPPCESPQVDLQAEVRGYVAGLTALKGYDFVDPEHVFILGLSMGGIVGPLVAKVIPVKGLIVAETVGKSWFEYELENLRRQFLLKGESYDEVENLVRQKHFCNYRLYVEKQLPEQIAQEAPYCAQLPHQPPAPYTYMQQVASLNLAEVWKPLNIPVLILYGAADFVTSADEHQYLMNLVNSYHPGRAKFVQIEHMDHWLRRASSMQESMRNAEGGELQPTVVAEIQQWLDSVLKQESQNRAQ